MPTESTLWDWLKKARIDLKDNLHIGRCENIAGVGNPDVDGMWMGKAFWIELKMCPKRPARPTTILRFGSPLRQSQLDWAAARTKAGGRVWYLIQVGAGHEAGRYLIHSKHVVRMHEGVTEAWCREHNSVDKPTPARVVLHAATA